jgi:ABC-type uncharacterized transport system ATPase subunit
VTLRSRTDRQWIVEVQGTLEGLMQTLAALPVRDLQIEPFRLEDYIARFYGMQIT